MWQDIKPSQLINSNRAAFWIPGFAVASWGPFIPYIKDKFELSVDQLGIMLMCMAVGAISALLFASPLLTKVGCRIVVQVCSAILAICLGLVTVIPNFYTLCVTLFIMGMSCEFLSMAANVNAGALEHLLKRNIMSGLHGVYSLGNAVGVFIVAGLLSLGLNFIAGNLLLTCCVFSLAVILYCGLIASRNLLTDLSVVEQSESDSKDSAPHKNEETSKTTGKKVFITPMLFLLGLICFIMFIVEGSMLDWTGVFLNTIKGMPLHEAGYGFAAFAIMMTICRLTGDKIVTTLGRRNVLTYGAIFAMAGLCLAVTMPHPIVCIMGFGMVGVGAANLVPQTISYAATVKEVPLQRSILIVNAIGYIGGLFGPALIGFIAHRIGLEYTFLLLASSIAVVALIAFAKIRNGSIATLTQANAPTKAQASAETSAEASAETSTEDSAEISAEASTEASAEASAPHNTQTSTQNTLAH